MKNVGNFEDYAELLAAKAFVRLLTSKCLEIRRIHDGIKHYQAASGLAPDMFSDEEKAVIQAAWIDHSAEDTISIAAEMIRRENPRNTRNITDSDGPLIQSIQKDLEAALPFQPPTSMCSV